MARQTSFFAWPFILLLLASLGPTASSFAQTANDGRRLEFPLFSIEAPQGNDWRQMVHERGKSFAGMDEEVAVFVWAIFTKWVPAVEKSDEPLKVMTTAILTSKRYRTAPDTSQELLANEMRGIEERLRKISSHKNISIRSIPTRVSESDCLRYFATYEDHRTLGALSPVYDSNARGLICVDGSAPGGVILIDYNERVLQGYSSLSSVEQEAIPFLDSLIIRKK